jgi:hypothetical protein
MHAKAAGFQPPTDHVPKRPVVFNK